MMQGPLLRVLFVCRGSRRDGLGHVMRSRCVAAEMSRRASVRMAVVGESFVDNLLAGRGVNYVVGEDESVVLETFRSFKPHVVVFDALRIGDETLNELRRCRLTVSLSPIFDHLSQVDLVFHRTEYFGDDWNFGSATSTGPEVRSGLPYAVIREQCLPIDEVTYRRSISQNPLAIVISMGGADAHNKTLETLRAIRQVRSPLLIWALLGEGYGHSYENLVECVRENRQHEIILAKTSDSMWRVMHSCALAILAGGTITYEAAYAGLPSINVFDDGAHVFLIRELVEKGLCVHAGYPFSDSLDVVVANLTYLEAHREELFAMHQRARGAIDGRGASRIAEEIVAAGTTRAAETSSKPVATRDAAQGFELEVRQIERQMDLLAEPGVAASSTFNSKQG